MSKLSLPIAFFTTIFFWASAFVGIRLGLAEFSPGSLALYRFLIASVILSTMLSCFKKIPSISTLHRFQLMLLGVFAIGVYNYCLNYGEMNIDAGVASFIIGQIPVITIILSVILLRESFPLSVWLGILISVIGMVVIALSNGHGKGVDANVLVVLIASACGAFYTLSQRQFLKTYHPISVTTWVIWGGTLSLSYFFPQLKVDLSHSTLQGNLIVVYLGIGPAALAYLAWCYILDHIPASRAALFLYALPLVSTILGFVILHETPTAMILFGSILALCGAILANYYIQKSIKN